MAKIRGIVPAADGELPPGVLPHRESAKGNTPSVWENVVDAPTSNTKVGITTTSTPALMRSRSRCEQAGGTPAVTAPRRERRAAAQASAVPTQPREPARNTGSRYINGATQPIPGPSVSKGRTTRVTATARTPACTSGSGCAERLAQ